MRESEFSQLPSVYQVRHLGKVNNLLDQAVRAARAGAGEGTLLVADSETSARTRRGKIWHSYPGNLHCALIVEPDYSNRLAQQLLYVAAVAAGTALAEVVAPMTGMSYGWPGKLYINNLLTGQVSIAAPAGGDDPWPWLVVCLRINVARHPPNPEPERYNCVHTSGEAEAVRAQEVLAFYARHFLRGINDWADEGFAPVQKVWMQRAQDLGTKRRIKLADSLLEGVNQGINKAGELLLCEAGGKTRRVSIKRYFAL